MKKRFAFLFLFILLSFATGCGNGKSGVIIRVTTDTPGIVPVSKPHRAVTGDLGSDFPDRNLTPHSLTIAFTSFKLFKTTDQQNTTTLPSYTVFDADPARPVVVSLTTGETTKVDENNSDPSRGTYNRIEYGVRYIEITIPLCNANDSCEDHRLRFYLTGDPDPDLNFTPAVGEILISRSVNGTDFSWISQSQGLLASLDLFPITGGRPIDPYLIPSATLFPPSGVVNPLFSQSLTPVLEINEKPDKEFVFTLNFDLTDLFFYDNTDEIDLDPGPDTFHFNALADSNSSRDGEIQRDCGADLTCRADFWPGIPTVTGVSVTQEDRKN